ncbi:MAG: hypothetical protein ACFHXK_18450 [bacterium]
MLDTVISYIVSEPETVAVYCAAGFVCLWSGWVCRGLGTTRREKDLKQAVLDAKRSIPQLETSVRSREQQIDRLNLELTSQRERIRELDQDAAKQDTQFRHQAREIRTLTTELASAKKLQDASGLLLQGNEYDTPSELDPESQRRVALAESLYEELRKTLGEREDQIAALEARIADHHNEAATSSASIDNDARQTVTALKDRISVQESTISRLESQLSELKQDREMLSELARSRSKSNQALQVHKDALQSRVPDLKRALEQLGAIVQDREASIRQLNSELEDANRDRKRQQEEIQNCISDIKIQEEAREALEVRVMSLSEEIQAQTEAMRDMQYSLEQSESWLSKFKVSAAKRSEELARVTAERDALIAAQQSPAEFTRKSNHVQQ